jgi:hypothetical protein
MLKRVGERGGGEDAKKHPLEPVSLCGQNVNEATARIFVNKKNCHNAIFGRKVAISAVMLSMGF